MYVFVCENSIEGIFTGVYNAWASGYGFRNIRLSLAAHTTYELFCEYIEVTPDPVKSQSVGRTICNRFGSEVYQNLCQAILAETKDKKNQLDKADCIYHTVLLAFALYDGSHVLEALHDPYVARIFELSRATYNEAHHLLGFLRFKELANGVLFSTIHPKNDVLPILAEHFTDRLPIEHFMIYDKTHKTAALHKASDGFVLIDASDLNQELVNQLSEREEEFQKLWCSFFNHIAIEARKNPKLQSQNIPLRFWKDTVELAR